MVEAVKADSPELVQAAQALETELVKLEELSRSVRKIRLHSDKSIARAAKEMNDALAVPERIAENLRGLALAMERMQMRQQAALEPLAATAAAIQARLQLLGQHMEAFASLGKAAGEVTALLQAVQSGQPAEPSPTNGAATGDATPSFAEVDARLTQLTDGARDLHDRARADDFPDVAREADALKQRVAAVRARLKSKN
jgi:hypothetical protein